MHLSARTYAAFALNGALDTGRYADLTTEEVVPSIEDGTIFAFLERRLGEDYRLGWLSEEHKAEFADEWDRFYNAIDSRRKFLVERNGLCLLLAYVLQGIQDDAMRAEEQRELWGRRN